MEPHVFAAVLAAAAMHAGWNASLKLKLEPFLAVTLLTGAAGIVALPAFVALGLPARASWPWLGASLLLHLGYYIVLSAAYARADMGQVYPIARGSAPLLTATVSMLLLQEPVSTVQLGGIAVLGGSVAAMSVLGRRDGASFDLRAVGLALLCATIICGYTLSDGIGARASGNPHAYSAALFVLDAAPLTVYALWRRGASALVPVLRHWPQGLVGGLLSLGAYWIAIWAMTVAPIPLVAALRETSVLFAMAIATFLLKEPPQRSRIVAATGIVAGIGLMRLG